VCVHRVKLQDKIYRTVLYWQFLTDEIPPKKKEEEKVQSREAYDESHLKIECIAKLTLPGYHTKWYKNYKTGVSTDRDSEVKGKGRSEEWSKTGTGETSFYGQDVPRSEIYRSSKLVLTLSGTCWRDNCWYGSEFWWK